MKKEKKSENVQDDLFIRLLSFPKMKNTLLFLPSAPIKYITQSKYLTVHSVVMACYQVVPCALTRRWVAVYAMQHLIWASDMICVGRVLLVYWQWRTLASINMMGSINDQKSTTFGSLQRFRVKYTKYCISGLHFHTCIRENQHTAAQKKAQDRCSLANYRNSYSSCSCFEEQQFIFHGQNDMGLLWRMFASDTSEISPKNLQ